MARKYGAGPPGNGIGPVKVGGKLIIARAQLRIGDGAHQHLGDEADPQTCGHQHMYRFPVQGFADGVRNKARLFAEPEAHLGEFLNFFQADERLVFQQGKIDIGKPLPICRSVGIMGVNGMVFGNRHQDFLKIDGLIFEQLVLRKQGQGAEVQIAVDQLLLEPVGDVLDDVDFDFRILGQKGGKQAREIMLAVKRGDSKSDGLLLG